MSITQEPRSVLVIEDEEETRYGIKRLLTTSGYRVFTAKNEDEAILTASLLRWDLVLMGLNVDAVAVLPVAKRIREGVGLSEEVPVVVFGVTSLDEGAEVEAGSNVYLTWPDNFDQLRDLLSRLLIKPLQAC